MSGATTYPDLNTLAAHLRQVLENKRYILIFAHNGIGKTRLSMAFKDIGQTVNADDKTEKRDTLYFNAFTEDLFWWDNDLDKGIERKLKLNRNSRFFAGLKSMEMDNRIRALLGRYADFDFQIDTATWEVVFDREIRVKKNGGAGTGQSRAEDDYETFRDEAIKVSRSEENIFIWCFFLAVVELALDDDGDGPYNWVNHIYVDDPISSLDDHHAIAVANHLAQLLKRSDGQHGAVVSTHHALFFNVLCNELNGANQYFLGRDRSGEGYLLRKTGKTPFFHHVATLAELHEVARDGHLYTHHFNMLRTILEKTASFHGHRSFSACIKRGTDDEEGILHRRLIGVLNHGNYSLFDPQEMQEENKQYFREILDGFISEYPFNPDIFTSEPAMEGDDTT